MELTSTAEDHRQSPALVAAILGQRAAALPPPMLSIVIPVFNEERTQTLHSRLTRTLTEQGLDYEIVFVDDGSQDQSPEMLRRLEAEDHRVVVVGLPEISAARLQSAPDWSIAADVSSALWMPISRIPRVLHTF